MGNPLAVRVGPGILKVAPIGTAEPADLVAAWNVAFVDLGYTDAGSNFVFNNTFENVMVAEEYEPVHVLQTAREIMVNLAAKEVTALNMQRAFNGGTVAVAGVVTTFEPLAAGLYTPVMLGWQSDDNLERWIFRRCIQVGSVDIPRKKAPDAAVIPLSFRCTKPSGATAFKLIYDTDWTPA